MKGNKCLKNWSSSKLQQDYSLGFNFLIIYDHYNSNLKFSKAIASVDWCWCGRAFACEAQGFAVVFWFSSVTQEMDGSCIQTENKNKQIDLSFFHAPVLLLMINWIIILSKWLSKSRATDEWFPQKKSIM